MNSFTPKAASVEETSILEDVLWRDNDRGCRHEVAQQLKLTNVTSFASTDYQNSQVTESSSCFEPRREEEMDLNGFSPGPSKLIIESKKKRIKDSYLPVRQQLNIDLLTNSEEDGKVSSPGFADEEEAFLNSIYRSLQELIISSQLREIVTEKLVVESEPNEDCKTPISPPLLLSISDKCPPAPVKPTLTIERDTHGICRKLEF